MKAKLIIISIAMLVFITGCNQNGEAGIRLNPDNPVIVTVWHFYAGAVLTAFDAMVHEFNETVGMERGIIIEAISFGGVSDLASAVISSAHREVGSMPLPNVFAAFPDTAYVLQELGLLSNLDEYFTPEQQAEYYTPFIDRGRMGDDGELRIFPVAQATEVLMINETDWRPFANAHGFTDADLATMESITRVAQVYYNETGRAFFGRDQFANFIIIGSKQFGTEIFEVNAGEVTINFNPTAMRRFWDYYFTPFVSGYFAAYGRFRSDDVRVGDLLAYVGSNTSAVFFPQEVRRDGETRAIQGRVLPPPLFDGGDAMLIQQGAGMVVTLDTPEVQYASLIFLRWFTEPFNNLRFSALTAYLPVRYAAMDASLVYNAALDAGLNFTLMAYETLHVALTTVRERTLYATSSFVGSSDARDVINTYLRNYAIAGRAEVLALIESGIPRADAIAQVTSDENFHAWVEGMRASLYRVVGK
ncbi:MAG: extracellular solute-binding protein [Defluviitaleaceae bacterium]|nr:extracellular solute-binding protein [Defluviitaleaceae bacterium]MCL2273809.1 extracellular solute-binding protein [Defluviitaleaceae bacterium]